MGVYILQASSVEGLAVLKMKKARTVVGCNRNRRGYLGLKKYQERETLTVQAPSSLEEFGLKRDNGVTRDEDVAYKMWW